LQVPKISAALGWLAQDCLLCGAASGDRAICVACEAGLPALDGAERRAHEPHLNEVIAAFDYAFPVDRIIHRFKFAADLAAGRWLALALAARVRELERPQLLVAPPLAAARLRLRGFNQALEIAKVIGRELGVRVAWRGIEKARETPPQHGLGRRERRANLRGAFRCALALDGEHVAIVDDVITTGATAEALASELRAAGAARVSAWALARTPDPAA
jgi:ComF family protein